MFVKYVFVVLLDFHLCLLFVMIYATPNILSLLIDIISIMKSVIVLLFIIVAALAFNKPYHKTVHVTDANARCLDGSPAFIYLSEGDPQNILLYFVGGASCGQTTLGGTL